MKNKICQIPCTGTREFSYPQTPRELLGVWKPLQDRETEVEDDLKVNWGFAFTIHPGQPGKSYKCFELHESENINFIKKRSSYENLQKNGTNLEENE